MAQQLSVLPDRPARSPRTLRPPRGPLGAARRADAELRTIVVRVRAWGLAIGRACSTDALTIVAGAAVDEARAGAASPLWWTADRVDHLLGRGALDYCDRHDIDVTSALLGELAPALSLWLEYLAARHAFSEGSRPAESLKAAARAAVGLLPDRRRRRATHPSGDRHG
jgi:hypothetical protein